MKIDFKKLCPSGIKNPFVGILNRYLKHKDEAKFDNELTREAIEHIDEMGYKSDPLKPQHLVELGVLQSRHDWLRKSKDARDEIVRICHRNEDVTSYFDKISSVQHKNRSNVHWLRFYFKSLDKNDTDNRQKVLNVLKTHEDEVPSVQYIS